VIKDIVEAFGLEFLIAAVFFIGGLIVEETYSLIGNNRAEKKGNNHFRIALMCVFEAEERLPGENRKRGAERLEYAIGLYKKRTGVRKYQEAKNAIMEAFMYLKASS